MPRFQPADRHAMRPAAGDGLEAVVSEELGVFALHLGRGSSPGSLQQLRAFAPGVTWAGEKRNLQLMIPYEYIKYKM